MTTGNCKTFQELQQLSSKESSDYSIVICNQNNIASIIVEVENSSNLIQHCPATRNVCADSEFGNNNTIAWIESICVLLFLV